MMQFGPQERRLKGVHSAVPANYLVLVFSGPPVVTQLSNTRREFAIRGNDCTCVSVCAEVFSRVEAEATSLPDGPGALAPFDRAMRLSSVFYHRKFVLIGECH